MDSPKPMGFMSFDVEALPARAENNHVDQLIWGKTSNGEYGIRRICSILDEYGIKGDFFVDMAGCLLYGDRPMQEICDFLLIAGHEVHVHLHSEWLFRRLHLRSNPNIMVGMNVLDESISRSFIDFSAYKYHQLTGREPSVFRSGGVHFNRNTIDCRQKKWI